MLSRSLISAEQHGQMAAWIAHARTPEAIMEMPEPLWRALQLASLLMNVDADLLQPPLLGADLGAGEVAGESAGEGAGEGAGKCANEGGPGA